MKKVMVRAWEIAREGAKKFGGKAIEYIAEALKLAWKEVKGLFDKVKDVKLNIDANDWMNYGKHRLYITVELSLVELKNINGVIIGAKRGLEKKVYYDWYSGNLYTQHNRGKDLTRAADEVIEYMEKLVKDAIKGKIDEYREIAIAKDKELMARLDG